MSEHRQDWEPVILKKRTPKTTNGAQTKTSNTEPKTVLRKASPNNNNAVNLPKSILYESTDQDPETLPTVLKTNGNLSTAIRSARNAKIMPNGLTMTQSELDLASQVPKNTVRDYENGTAVYNAEQVNKIARVLGVTLPRPKRQ